MLRALQPHILYELFIRILLNTFRSANGKGRCPAFHALSITSCTVVFRKPGANGMAFETGSMSDLIVMTIQHLELYGAT
ncbi:hypothetical protein AGJ34_18585 [Cronobacter dublinensis subsp. dublinensis]|nr:hypothetical protein [Cronobacter dublinensis subsp. dublinensis]EGT5667459.1 hypothetical protein [Cronobacter dublinensis subsp. dublinensis]EGT5674989.1 hypothetical protein [Cronobacter dublinensis subsp. dublinensis]EGT5678915.1 hypothetical protein [Cronobacter dublinensis subsp. dublinensis]EGT5685937.1 hypothetical protein [Cronobacter dublinensis subsp. dublinensis]